MVEFHACRNSSRTIKEFDCSFDWIRKFSSGMLMIKHAEDLWREPGGASLQGHADV